MGRLDFIYRMELSHRAKSVYIYLADRANKDGECWPAIPTIAKELEDCTASLAGFAQSWSAGN